MPDTRGLRGQFREDAEKPATGISEVPIHPNLVGRLS